LRVAAHQRLKSGVSTPRDLIEGILGMRTTKCFALLGGLAIGVGIGLAPLAAVATGQPRVMTEQYLGKTITTARPAVLNQSREVEVFVRLKTPSVAEY